MARSAGLLLFLCGENGLEVLLIHPGGPFWAKKDDGAWSIPKGEYGAGDDPLSAALREFEEETGTGAQGEFLPLGEVRQPGGKAVTAWAVEQDLDAASLRSNLFEMEWPPKSGKTQSFPEVDRAQWFTISEARRKLLKGQTPFLDRLVDVAAR